MYSKMDGRAPLRELLLQCLAWCPKEGCELDFPTMDRGELLELILKLESQPPCIDDPVQLMDAAISTCMKRHAVAGEVETTSQSPYHWVSEALILGIGQLSLRDGRHLWQ